MAKRSNEELLSWQEVQDDDLSALIREAHGLRAAADRLAIVKARIVELTQGRGGIRSGALCCLVRWADGRRMLDRVLLVENGVTPEQIERSMKQSAGGWVCELPEIEP